MKFCCSIHYYVSAVINYTPPPHVYCAVGQLLGNWSIECQEQATKGSCHRYGCKDGSLDMVLEPGTYNDFSLLILW